MTEWRMAKSKKLSRADVHKQIDAFRGIFKRSPDGKLSAEQWVETKRAEDESMKRKPLRLVALGRQSTV